MRCPRAWLWLAAAAAGAACSGSGSDIGPRFPQLSGNSGKAVVLDDQGRGVVEARVSVLGSGAVALTGRNGRGDLFGLPIGRQRIEVDGAAAAAAAGDRLGSLVFATTIVGPDLPAVTYLPDLPDSASATVAVGTLASQVAITSVRGGVLTLGAGCSIGVATGAASVTLRAGDLQAHHLPGELPVNSGFATLFGRGFYVDPPGVSFTPPASLDVEDDLELPNGIQASLYHLDPTTGEWTAIGSAASSGGRITAGAAIAGGGLYAFGCPVPAATVQGRFVDRNRNGIPDIMVVVDGVWTRTDSSGRFVVGTAPGQGADGSAHTASVELFAGGSWLPVRTGTTVAVTAGATADLGEIAFDTMFAGNVRVQQIRRGRAEPLRRVAISSLFGAVAQVATGDANGQAVFEDVPSQWFGFQDALPYDANAVYYAQRASYLQDGQRWLDDSQFFDEVAWYLGARRSRTIVTDTVGGGPIYDAAVVSGMVDGQGFVGETRESGVIVVDRDFGGRATASLRTEREGRTVVHAFSIQRPNGEHVELPLQQALRTPVGAFDRHGLVAGTLVGADPSRAHRLRSTRVLDLLEWWNDVVEGVPLPSSVPIDVDPATTHGAFQVGVARAGGNLAAVELTVSGGRTTLDKAGLAADLVPVEGAVTARDLPLDLVATTPFAVAAGLAGLDASISANELTFALALERPSGHLVDVARDLGGNLAATGSDLTFTLPALTGQLAGHHWLALVHGSAVAGGFTETQQALVRLSGNGAEAAVPLLPVPDLVSPAANATVPASGFAVEFVLPAGAIYATLELRSETSGELFLWDVTLPPDQTSYSFQRLPTEAATPLVAGRTYTLSLTAYRADRGPLSGAQDPYRDLAGFLQSIGPTELGVVAASTRSITVTAN